MKMHAGEVDIDADIVRRLVADQFPDLAALPVREVESTGTVNAIYRIGDDLYARLPRLQAWSGDLERESRWLPRLAPRLSLEVPAPLRVGRPSPAYPLFWAVYRWIPGEPYADALVKDEAGAARQLARFVTELRAVDPSGVPPAGRKPLPVLDADTRAAIDAAHAVIDSIAAGDAWSHSLDAPEWTGEPVWIHGDLLRPNVLVADGHIRAVLDWGGSGIGDPANDLIPAWSVFGAAGRAVFRDALDVDDGTWSRARGIALHQAALIIPYYRETNPAFVSLAIRTIGEVLADRND